MADENEDTVQDEAADPKVEAKAREMGWSPRENWKGPEDKWIDAETFVENGEKILPIVNAHNRDLKAKLVRLEGVVTEQQKIIQASQEAMAALEEFHTSETKRQVAEARKGLVSQIKTAKREGDVDSEVELTSELSKLDAAEATAAGEPPKKEAKKAETVTPDSRDIDPGFAAWWKKNPWFGVDQRKSIIMESQAKIMRLSGDYDDLSGEDFFEAVQAVVEGKKPTARREDKVEGSRGGSGATRGGKTWSDLSREEKDACDSFNSRLVGEGRVHKDIASWRKAYIKKLYGDGA